MCHLLLRGSMDNKYFVCSLEQFDHLLEKIRGDGYELLGPTVRNQVIVLDKIHSSQDLPVGWRDEQSPGSYRLKRRNDNAYFGYNLGPHSWKKFLFPPQEKLFTATKQSNGLVVFQEAMSKFQKMAFLGVRACEIQAILIQDRVFIQKSAVHEQYKKRREDLLLIAVNCTCSASTCFCVSMDAGPHVREGYDLALTEVITEKEHYFIVASSSERGKALCKALNLSSCEENKVTLGFSLVEKTKEELIRKVDNYDIEQMLEKSLESKRWDAVAKRCVNCANCTLVCPTCFCSTHEDRVSLDKTHSERWQSWDSCFNHSFSYVHGGSIRDSAKSRYRQWLTHKFGTWWAQFGCSGCVGCGRCITWCPVGIDVTEELKELRKESYENNC